MFFALLVIFTVEGERFFHQMLETRHCYGQKALSYEML